MKQKYGLIVILLLLFFVNTEARANGDISAQDALDIASKYYKVENYPEAMRYYTMTMQKAQLEKNQRAYLVSIGYISNIYFNYNDYSRALHYLLKGYDTAKTTTNNKIQFSYLTNIIATYCRLNQPVKAREYYNILEKLPQKGFTADNEYYKMYNYGRILRAEKKYDEALKQFYATRDFAKAHHMTTMYDLNLLSEIGNLYVETSDYDKALAYGKQCAELSKQIGSKELLTNAYQMLADAYTGLDDSANANIYRNLHNETADSVYNLPNLTSASTELFNYENSQNEEKIKSLNSSMGNLVIVVIILAVFIILLAALFFLVYRNNKRMNEGQLKLLEENRDILAKTVDKVKVSSSSAKDGAEREKRLKLLGQINEVINDGKSISDPDFSLQKLADAVGSNTKYVSQVINEYYNKNFKTLLNECRLREATRRLADQEHYGNMTIQAIYEEVGYTNAVSFIRAFKRMYGITPSEYQKNAAEKKQGGSN